MYHLELRQFPHNLNRFNLSDDELRAIVEPWTHDPWVELGERKWRPETAKITILEGPQIPLEQLSMGRGWRIVQRDSKDVTDRILAAAKQHAGAVTSQQPQHGSPPDAALVADSLGLELVALLAEHPAPLSVAWRLAAERFPERSPSESLALAEAAVASLLRGHLIALLRPAAPDAPGDADLHSTERRAGEGEIAALLCASDSWADHDAATAVLLCRV